MNEAHPSSLLVSDDEATMARPLPRGNGRAGNDTSQEVFGAAATSITDRTASFSSLTVECNVIRSQEKDHPPQQQEDDKSQIMSSSASSSSSSASETTATIARPSSSQSFPPLNRPNKISTTTNINVGSGKWNALMNQQQRDGKLHWQTNTKNAYSADSFASASSSFTSEPRPRRAGVNNGSVDDSYDRVSSDHDQASSPKPSPTTARRRQDDEIYDMVISSSNKKKKHHHKRNKNADRFKVAVRLGDAATHFLNQLVGGDSGNGNAQSGYGDNRKSKGFKQKMIGSSTTDKIMMMKSCVDNVIVVMQDEDWRKEWSGIHLPPSAFNPVVFVDAGGRRRAHSAERVPKQLAAPNNVYDDESMSGTRTSDDNSSLPTKNDVSKEQHPKTPKVADADDQNQNQLLSPPHVDAVEKRQEPTLKQRRVPDGVPSSLSYSIHQDKISPDASLLSASPSPSSAEEDTAARRSSSSQAFPPFNRHHGTTATNNRDIGSGKWNKLMMQQQQDDTLRRQTVSENAYSADSSTRTSATSSFTTRPRRTAGRYGSVRSNQASTKPSPNKKKKHHQKKKKNADRLKVTVRLGDAATHFLNHLVGASGKGGNGNNKKPKDFKQMMIGSTTTNKMMMMKSSVGSGIAVMQDEDWRKEWYGIHLPPSAFNPSIVANGRKSGGDQHHPNTPKSVHREAVNQNGPEDILLPSSLSFSNQRSVPLYTLLACMLLYWFLKYFLVRRVFTCQKRTLLVRTAKQKVMALWFGGHSGQHVVNQEELEKHIQKLKLQNDSHRSDQDRHGDTKGIVGIGGMSRSNKMSTDDYNGTDDRRSSNDGVANDDNRHHRKNSNCDGNQYHTKELQGNTAKNTSNSRTSEFVVDRGYSDQTSFIQYMKDTEELDSAYQKNEELAADAACANEHAEMLQEQLSLMKVDKAALLQEVTALEDQTALYNEGNVLLAKKVIKMEMENNEQAEQLVKGNLALKLALKGELVKLREEKKEEKTNHLLHEVQNENAALTQKLAALTDQTTLYQEALQRAGLLYKENVLLKEKVDMLQEENEEMNLEVDHLFDELGENCDADLGSNKHEGEDVEFHKSNSLGSLLLGSLTTDGDDSELSEKDELQISIDKLHEELKSARLDVARITKERDDAVKMMANKQKERRSLSQDLTPNDISFEDLTSSSHHTMESYEALRAEKEELQRTLFLVMKNTSRDDVAKKQLCEKDAALEEVKSDITAMTGDESSAMSQVLDHVTAELCNQKGAVEDQVTAEEEEEERVTILLDYKLEAEHQQAGAAATAAAAMQLAEVEGKLKAAILSNTDLKDQVASLHNTNKDVTRLLLKKESLLKEAKLNIIAMIDEAL